jgi:hypothetical protein
LRCEQPRRTADIAIGATVAFGIHYERAVLAWMDELPELLAGVPTAATGS